MPEIKKKKKVGKTKRKKFDSFSEKSLKKYIGILKKMRKKKNNKKKKKVSITNTASMLNLLYNVDRERKKKKKQNLMKMHPYGYPALIKDKDIKKIWSGTRVNYGNKRQMMGNLNKAIRSLYGFDLYKPRRRRDGKLPVGQRGPITMQRPRQPGTEASPPTPRAPPYEEPNERMGRSRTRVPSSIQAEPARSRAPSPPPARVRQSLPTKPSSAPPMRYDDSDGDSDSVSDSDSEERRRKRRR